MNLITLGLWAKTVEREAQVLGPILETALAQPELCDAMRALARDASKHDPGRYAPLFHVSKMLLRDHPALWAEAQRLEAEVRFIAGLFVPFALLFLDGLWLLLRQHDGVVITVVSCVAMATILPAYTYRRSREIYYNQLLAIVALRLHKESPPQLGQQGHA
jgi:hypothetical protein